MFSLKDLKRLGVGAALVSALAFSGLGATAQAAVPAPTGSPNPSTITQNTGSLTIHKHKQGASLGTAGNGLALETAPDDPLQGVTFKVEKVKNVDLKTNAGWVAAEAIAKAFKNGDAPVLDTAFTAIEQETGADGTTKFADLPVGYYLVTETDNSGAKDANGKAVTGLIGVKPFLVSIPMTHPTDLNSWVYDVHVYPKNQPIEVDKAVTDKGKNVGDDVVYTVNTGIPNVAEGDTITKYVINDPLPDGTDTKTGKLTYKADSAKVALTTTVTGKTLIKDTDYTLTTADHKVLVEFTKDGRAKLAEVRRADANATVTLTFTATINAVATDGSVHNTVYLAPSEEYDTEPGGDNPPPGDEVISKFGKAKFIKLASDKAAPSNKLADAEFQLYLCEDLSKAKPTPLTVNGVNTWKSNAQGAFEIVGLHASDWIDGKADTTTYTASNPQYCLVETKAPSGYELLPEPIKFNVPAGQGYDAKIAYNDIEVKNYPKNGGFDLPLTGSNALILVTLAGACLLGGGAFLFLRGRKDSEA